MSRTTPLSGVPAEPPTSGHPPKGGSEAASRSDTPSSSVQPLQTKSPPPAAYIAFTKWSRPEFDVQPVTEAESTFRHSGWAVRRAQIWNALTRLHVNEGRRSRFANCGSAQWLHVTTSGDDMKLVCNKCHDRWCMACANDRSAAIVENVARMVDGKFCRFMTLTLAHSLTPLSDQIDRLYRSFSAFRRRASWRQHVDGGAAFLEAKISDKDGLWHVHLHLITEGKFWDQREISREWHGVTGDSSIVDIRRVDGSEHVARYVTKYLTKPADSSVFVNTERLDEMITAYAGRRLCLTFGTWRGQKLEELPEDERQWQTCGSLDTLRSRANAGEVEAIRWLEAAHRKWPLLKVLYPLPPPSDPLDTVT